MSYLYDAGGARVIRQKGDGEIGGLTDIKQDLYIGSYERRQVQLKDMNNNDNAASMHVEYPGEEYWGYYQNIDGTRLVKYTTGVRVQRDWDDTLGEYEAEMIFLSFGNHLGSTSAVIDFKTGELTEWKTNYAYGADESHWKNPAPKYDNGEEPYGFTGKEEDSEVGLHYFGARYYSSYLGRWLGPDPPVVHGGGSGNHFNYGGNSPYIYVDPDGNSITAAIVGAIVGAVVGAVSAGIQSKGDIGQIIWGAVKGAFFGAMGGSGVVGPLGMACLSAGVTAGEQAVAGAPAGEFFKNVGISFASSLIGGGMGQSFSYAGLKSAGAAFANYAVSLGLTYSAAAATG
ncbi:MAG: RHS repeat-associated core domain-containing protein, partial [Gammaproteobacteria bacterium]|nr:RHS repeat-associated core domain-containing protein [Gammaproteobacteria bacterium]